MSRRITTDEIVQTVFERHEEGICALYIEGCGSMPYSYGDFRRDMRIAELMVDDRTIRDRWELLMDKNMVERARDGVLSGRTFFILSAFESRILRSRVFADLRDAHTHAHTHRMHYTSKTTASEGAQ